MLCFRSTSVLLSVNCIVCYAPKFCQIIEIMIHK